MTMLSTKTGLCAVIGNPVEHSLSPTIHNAGFQAAGLDYVYLAFRVEDVGSFLGGMRAMPNFRGLSVTIPHKAAVMDYLDEIEPMAEHVGSVNTVTNEAGRLIGSTTDGPGTLRAFRDAGVELEGKRALFLGSGGAVRAVAFAFAELAKTSHISILGRTETKVDGLVADIREKSGASVSGGSLTDGLSAAMAEHDILIQGTPVGMYPKEDGIPVEPGLLRPEMTVFDMVYRPRKTRLIQEAESRGCKVIPGLEMLLNQAVLQFERWTGVDAPYDAMRLALATALNAS